MGRCEGEALAVWAILRNSSNQQSPRDPGQERERNEKETRTKKERNEPHAHLLANDFRALTMVMRRERPFFGTGFGGGDGIFLGGPAALVVVRVEGDPSGSGWSVSRSSELAADCVSDEPCRASLRRACGAHGGRG